MKMWLAWIAKVITIVVVCYYDSEVLSFKLNPIVNEPETVAYVLTLGKRQGNVESCDVTSSTTYHEKWPSYNGV